MPDSQPREIPVNPEIISSPENIGSPENTLESPPVQEKPSVGPDSATPRLTPAISSNAPSAVGDVIVLKKVESILAENMDSIFLSLDSNSQIDFKIKGEETAKKITTLLSQAKVKVKDLIDLIIDWLRVIPRVNRYYLEQEAKLKADAIWHLYKK